MPKRCLVLAACAISVVSASAYAQSVQQEVGYTQLQQEQGANIATGQGVNVMQVEANLGGNDDPPADPPIYEPDPSDSQFSHDTFNDVNAGTISSHATTVGEYFYGSASSFAPGITHVDVYEADDWLATSFLNTGTSDQPGSTMDRIINDSWVGAETTNAANLDALSRLDYVIETDACINVAACNNPGNGGPQPLLAGSFNSILVGLSDGSAEFGSTDLGSSLYTSGRAAPDVVAPSGLTSFATPMVSSTAALLVSLAHGNPSLSNGTFTANGQVLEYGESPDVIKAAIMAGADRVVNYNGDTISDYGANGYTANNLDSRYGAGQLDVYNSYHIILAGQQSPGNIGTYGFDYNPSSAQSSVEDYIFTGRTGIQATLAWEAHITGDNAGSLADFQLKLFLVGGTTPIAQSVSTIDNTQNIYVLNGLIAADTYDLQVSRAASDNLGSWDYALAWDLNPVPEPDAASAVGFFVVIFALSRRRNSKSEIRNSNQIRMFK
jgi:hypothetical protein